jgi:hypothetical protein
MEPDIFINVQYAGPHVKCVLLLLDFNETWILSTDFRKLLVQKFHENPSRGSQIVSCGRADRHGGDDSPILAVFLTHLKYVL